MSSKKVLTCMAVLIFIMTVTILDKAKIVDINPFNNSKPQTSTPPSPDNTPISNDGEKQRLEEGGPVKTPQASPPNNPTPVVSISKLYVESGALVVQTKLTGGNWQSCILNLTRDDSRISKTADIIYQSDFSSCKGFSIPISEFNISGRWEVMLTAIPAGDKPINSSLQSINIVK